MSGAFRVLILTEAGGSRGFGHLSRCSAIREALEEHRVETALYVDIPLQAEAPWSGVGYKQISWLEALPARDELASYDAVIIDSYIAERSLYQSLALTVPYVVAVDDTCRLAYPVSGIINPCISATESLYQGYEGDLFVGSAYSMLRRPFWKCAGPQASNELSNVLVSVGGGDGAGLGARIAMALTERFPGIRVHLLAGSQTSTLRLSEWITVHSNIDADKTREIMEQCDVAVSAAGQTLHELGALGIPTIMFPVADNQVANVEAWHQTGAFLRVGKPTEADLISQIERSLAELTSVHERRVRGARAREAIDGKGALRLASALIDRMAKSRCSIRPVETADCQAVYEISNDSSVRQRSFSSAPIDFGDHQQWFAKTISDPSVLFLVAMVDSEVVGQMRIQRIDEQSGVVNISVKPECRSLKIGNSLLHAAYRESRARFPEMQRLLAQIQLSNPESIRFFERAGFSLQREFVVGDSPRVEYSYTLR